ncbi:MAG: anaerobic glycerol-3-phosphate dehydrogenase subunit A [Desulfovibrio sp.]|nr:anaerobic glycerol-3-phosphate dehydrogenase subunit A [Desulfovibrio sp.]
MSVDRIETDVVVIGGGATGIGTLRDLSLRGIAAVLVEQGGIAHGTSSRFHGLLHSGGRYAVSDTLSAKECIEENTILRRIGAQCVEETEGFFVLLPEDDPDYVEPWLKGCAEAGIQTEELSVEEARRLEPEISPQALRVFRVPDSCVDGFRLVLHNAMSARRHGGRVLLYHKVTGISQANGNIQSVDVIDTLTQTKKTLYCRAVVNAAGSWSGQIAALAGLDVPVSPDKGSLIVFNHRFTSRVVNRLHPGSDGDIFVPHGSITILGTTSVATDRPDDTKPTREEILRLLAIGEPLFPKLQTYRILRAFAGTRPLYTPGNAQGRNASRNFQVFDHASDGLHGFFSIFGGKLTTYRLMAEKVCNAVASYLNVNTACTTKDQPMVEEASAEHLKAARHAFPVGDLSLMADRVGDDLEKVLDLAKKRTSSSSAGNPLICECEMVSLAEIESIAQDPDSHTLTDIRLRTRLGMGTCQGTFCALRAVNAMFEHDIPLSRDPLYELRAFLQERFRGLAPTLWGIQAQEMQLSRAIYAGVLNLRKETYAVKN